MRRERAAGFAAALVLGIGAASHISACSSAGDGAASESKEAGAPEGDGAADDATNASADADANADANANANANANADANANANANADANADANANANADAGPNADSGSDAAGDYGTPCTTIGAPSNCTGLFNLCQNDQGTPVCTKACTYPGGGGAQPDPTECPAPTTGTCTPKSFCK